MKPDTVGYAADFLERHDIRTVEVSLVDLAGALRGKRLPAEAFRSGGLRGEVGFSSALYAWDYAAEVFTDDRYNWATGYPDIFLRPDLATLRLVPWRPATAFVVCDVVDDQGEAVDVGPRHILRRCLAGLEAAGYSARVGLETEFYVLDPETRTPRTQRNPCYSLHDGSDLEPMLAEVRAALSAAGAEVEASGAEYGPGQAEINLRYADPLSAADDLVFLRYAVKQIAARHGMLATFMPKPFTELSGSGLHVHQSLWNSAGENIFWDAGTGGLSEPARRYLAGLLRYVPETYAVAAPTPNGYKRIVDHSFAPTTLSWGSDNRSVAVRALVRGTEGTRLEYRAATSDANPYLLTATTLAAGLAGIRDGLTPAAPASTDAYETAEHGRLPTDPAVAARLLRDSSFAKSVLGERAVNLVATVTERETSLHRAQVGDWERNRYLEAV